MSKSQKINEMTDPLYFMLQMKELKITGQVPNEVPPQMENLGTSEKKGESQS
jgi:hypothetical protein